VIVRLNGEKVESQEDFYRKLWKTRIGDDVNIVVLRDAKFQVVAVRTIDRQSILRTPGN
jgi:S1-C subfamily serine protease